MKALITTLKKANSITNDSLFVNRNVLRFSSTNDALFNGVKRYAH